MIGLMNVFYMGWDNGKDYIIFVCVLSYFVIIVFNEVEFEDVMNEFEVVLEVVIDEVWDYYISLKEVGNNDGCEYYVFIWCEIWVSFFGGVGFFDDFNDVIKWDFYGVNF